MSTADESSFTISYVPLDISRPVSARSVTYTKESVVSCLTDTLKEHFKSAHVVNGREGRAKLGQFAAMLKNQVTDRVKGTNVDTDAIVSAMTAMQLVDIVPLLQQHPSNGWECVSMYVDDNAMNKGVPLNRRATELCASCGVKKAIYGDAFIARAVDDNNDLYERKDFLVKDLSSDASWMKKARTINARTGGSTNATQLRALQESIARPSPSLEAMKTAKDLKDKGNEAFKRGEMDVAMKNYEGAIEALGEIDLTSDHESTGLCQVLWMNMAAVELQRGRWTNAETVASKAIEIWPKPKAYYRRARARERLGRLEACQADLKAALKLSPNDKLIKRTLLAIVRSGSWPAKK